MSWCYPVCLASSSDAYDWRYFYYPESQIASNNLARSSPYSSQPSHESEVNPSSSLGIDIIQKRLASEAIIQGLKAEGGLQKKKTRKAEAKIRHLKAKLKELEEEIKVLKRSDTVANHEMDQQKWGIELDVQAWF
ncbi:hypothetical protein VKT23_013634 [Stygiomarasmius scandens]|uniref:Uncharacterized protein n=1 Tax=Marasmiellus scandens TaxID=2682957 RepID=A0ABR1J2X4_9AGAR